MNRKQISKFKLSYYSLTSQIIIINFITAIIGLIVVGVFNMYLLKNNENIDIIIDQMNTQIDSITNYLEKAAILKTHVINEKTNEVFITSEPYLDPYRSQEYIENKYLNQSYEVRIYDNNLTKYVDTNELYIPEDVVEIDVIEGKKNLNLFKQYKNVYYFFYNYLQLEFNKNKLINQIQPKRNEINLIIETIKNNNKFINYFIDENDSLYLNILNPIKQNDNIHGVVLIKSLLFYEENNSVNASFIFWNLFLIIIFFMFLLSIFFTRSIIHPIKTLSSLVMFEKNKFNNSPNNMSYPIRNDEIGGLSNNIKKMSTELKLRINELENFASDVSHELKNPLSSLKTSSELLAENKIKLKDRELLFVNIKNDLNRMNRLISDISEYTRTQAEVEKEKFQEFNFIEFIKDLEVSFLHNKKNIKILLELNDSKIMVKANIDKLAQVFINLIENAISFSPKNSKIHIQQFLKKNEVIIIIADQGIGISEDLKDKIFERFYTDRPEKTEYHTGLGLSISKKIMESFSGSLELSNLKINNYNGACFKLKLPLITTLVYD